MNDVEEVTVRDRTSERALVALATLFAVLVMHGLACMVGDDHASHHLSPMDSVLATVGLGAADSITGGAAHARDMPTTASAALAAGVRTGVYGPDPQRHQGFVLVAVCVAILTGSALLLFALAMLAGSSGPPPGDLRDARASARWRRARAPTARLRPSPFRLCVLRT